MESKAKILTLIVLGILIGSGINQYINDKDLDGVPNENDAFPNDATEWEDYDGDGIGNNADLDDDNDGYEDTEDINPLNDLALNFNLEWIELIDKQNNRACLLYTSDAADE